MAAIPLAMLSFALPLALATTAAQTAGTYVLDGSSDPSCPQTLSHPAPTALTAPVLTLAHSDIKHDGDATCSGALTNLLPAADMLRSTPSSVDRTDPLVEALLRTDALIGVDSAARTCGSFTLRAGSLVAYVNSRDDSNFLGDVPQLSEGRTLLLLAEKSGDSPKRCLYFTDTAAAEAPGSGCFPRGTLLTTPSGALPVEHAARGAALSTGRVLLRTHADASDARHEYVEIAAAGAADRLVLSPGHYVVLRAGGLRAARAVRAGDVLMGSDGAARVVEGVSRVWREGRYNPHTESGELDVAGFRVSCYTEEVHPALAAAGVRLMAAAGSVLPERVLSWVADALERPDEGVVAALRWAVPKGGVGA